ncbi:hypothetical protein, partial [Burkholderia diffusa]|uniref:hypothetical protein n=1 Tax=Burkholderia diffusa TaxID=488732 RepID=UPI001E2FDD33
ARNLKFLSSAAFSAAEKRDYEPSFSVRQQLFNCFVATTGVQLRVRRGALQPTQPHRLPSFLPRRVAVSAKEA